MVSNAQIFVEVLRAINVVDFTANIRMCVLVFGCVYILRASFIFIPLFSSFWCPHWAIAKLHNKCKATKKEYL